MNLFFYKRGSCKTSVLQEQPLKTACLAARRARNCIAAEKLTEFCNRLKSGKNHAVIFFIVASAVLTAFSCKDETEIYLTYDWVNVVSPPGVNYNIKISSNTATVNFENLENKDIYLVKVNISNLTAEDKNTGGIQSSVLEPPQYGRMSLSSRNIPYPPDSEFPVMGHPAATLFHANPPIISPAARMSGIHNAAIVIPPLDSQKPFWVETFMNSKAFVTKSATYLAEGNYSRVWVMEDAYGGASKTFADRNEARTYAQKIAGKFDLIYPAMTGLLGYEYGGSPGHPMPGGMDGDPKIQILVYNIRDNENKSSGVLGYYWSKDNYTDEQLSHGLKSNKAEIFYIDADYLKSRPELIYSTLIHEFQHMIHYNVKTIVRGQSSPSWYNEMLSMMAEDVFASLVGIAPSNPDHVIQGRMPYFNYYYYQEGITQWSGSSSVSYSTKYAFGAYLLRNYGGAELFRRILENNSVGIHSITSALSGSLTFYDVLFRYGEAMIYYDPSLNNINSFAKSIGNSIAGFNIWGKEIPEKYLNELGVYATVGTTGPRYYPLNTRVKMPPHSVVVHSDNSWKNVSSNEAGPPFEIILDKPAHTNVVLFIMVRNRP